MTKRKNEKPQTVGAVAGAMGEAANTIAQAMEIANNQVMTELAEAIEEEALASAVMSAKQLTNRLQQISLRHDLESIAAALKWMLDDNTEEIGLGNVPAAIVDNERRRIIGEIVRNRNMVKEGSKENV
jgi:hypothetical protein